MKIKSGPPSGVTKKVNKEFFAYFLIKLSETCDALLIFKELSQITFSLQCEAVRGSYDVLLTVSGKSEAEIRGTIKDVVNSISGVEVVEILEIASTKIASLEKIPVQKDNLLGVKGVFGYILLEIKPNAVKKINQAILQKECVLGSNVIKGRINLVVMIKGSSFGAFKSFIANEIRCLPGILHTQLLKVIDLGQKLNFPRLNHDVWRYRGETGQLIPLLQAAQESYGFIPEIAVKYISDATGRPESEIYGVITFYKQFRLRPVGKYLVRLCDGTACHVNNAKMLREVIIDELKLTNNDTTEDGIFTLVPVACLGCCSLAPAMMVNEMTHGRLTPQSIRSILRNYRREGLAQLKQSEVAA